jgi:hypothetical protein
MNREFEEEIQELQDTLAECRSMLRINPMELDEECRRQPEKFEAVGQLATRAKALSRKAKDLLDYTESEIKSKVRRDPANYGLTGKVTNDAVNETVEIQTELQDAKRDYIELSKLSDGFSILVNSMEQRKAMLRDLVSLYVHKYYSNQSLSGEERSLDKNFEEDLAEERSRDIEKD